MAGVLKKKYNNAKHAKKKIGSQGKRGGRARGRGGEGAGAGPIIS